MSEIAACIPSLIPMILQLFHFLLPVSPLVSNRSCQLVNVSCCTVLLYFSKSCFVQLLSHVQLLVTPWIEVCQAPLSSTVSWSLFKFMSTESVMLSNHLILCCPLFLFPSILPRIRVFFHESAVCIRWPKYWSFSFSISPSNEYSGLISLRIDWFDLPAVQGTLKKSLLQHHDSKALILWHLVFFMFQLSHLYDYWKNHSFD